jgi:hypothetical protein
MINIEEKIMTYFDQCTEVPVMLVFWSVELTDDTLDCCCCETLPSETTPIRWKTMKLYLLFLKILLS